MVAFGTGANLTDNDRSSTDVQSVYSILDNTHYKIDSGKLVINTDISDDGVIPTAVSGTSDLVKQDMVDTTGIAGQGVSSARRFWQMTQNNVNYDATKGPVKKGWYFNFQVTSERVLRPMSFFDGSNNLMVFSVTPAYGGTVLLTKPVNRQARRRKPTLPCSISWMARSQACKLWTAMGMAFTTRQMTACHG